MKFFHISSLVFLILLSVHVQSQVLQVKFYNRTWHNITELTILGKPVGTLNKNASVVIEFDSLDVCNGIPCETHNISGKITGLALGSPINAYVYEPGQIKRMDKNDKPEFDIVLEQIVSFKKTFLCFRKHKVPKAKTVKPAGASNK